MAKKKIMKNQANNSSADDSGNTLNDRCQVDDSQHDPDKDFKIPKKNSSEFESAIKTFFKQRGSTISKKRGPKKDKPPPEEQLPLPLSNKIIPQGKAKPKTKTTIKFTMEVTVEVFSY